MIFHPHDMNKQQQEPGEEEEQHLYQDQISVGDISPKGIEETLEAFFDFKSKTPMLEQKGRKMIETDQQQFHRDRPCPGETAVDLFLSFSFLFALA